LATVWLGRQCMTAVRWLYQKMWNKEKIRIKNISFAAVKRNMNSKLMLLAMPIVLLFFFIVSFQSYGISNFKNTCFKNQIAFNTANDSQSYQVLKHSITEQNGQSFVFSLPSDKGLAKHEPPAEKEEQEEENSETEKDDFQSKITSNNKLVIDASNVYAYVLISQLELKFLNRRSDPLFLIFHSWKSFLS